MLSQLSYSPTGGDETIARPGERQTPLLRAGVRRVILPAALAGVAELVYATDSKSVAPRGVWVRVPPPAPPNAG